MSKGPLEYIKHIRDEIAFIFQSTGKEVKTRNSKTQIQQ